MNEIVNAAIKWNSVCSCARIFDGTFLRTCHQMSRCNIWKFFLGTLLDGVAVVAVTLIRSFVDSFDSTITMAALMDEARPGVADICGAYRRPNSLLSKRQCSHSSQRPCASYRASVPVDLSPFVYSTYRTSGVSPRHSQFAQKRSRVSPSSSTSLSNACCWSLVN